MPKALKQKQEYGIPLSRYSVFLQNCPLGHDPKANGFFQLNPPMAEEIHLRWMKSLRDEICLSAGDGGGFSLSEAARLRFHLRRNAEDFIRAPLGFHRATHDFILFGSVDRFEPAKRLKYLQNCGIMKVQ